MPMGRERRFSALKEMSGIPWGSPLAQGDAWEQRYPIRELPPSICSWNRRSLCAQKSVGVRCSCEQVLFPKKFHLSVL